MDSGRAKPNPREATTPSSTSQREARARLDSALAEREAVRAASAAADAALADAMRDALEAGVTVSEVAELTGYHRNSVRRITLGE